MAARPGQADPAGSAQQGPPPPPAGGRGGTLVVTNVVFVVDTSASMNQRIYNGLSLLDCAKAAIEHFLKVRGRDLRFDRLFLLTFDDSPSGIKVGWGNDSFMKFTEEVKNLVATDLSAVGTALKRAFDLLNQVRFSSGFDNYGLGRIPWLPEPSVVILLTDGGALTSHSGVLGNLVLPPTPQPGSELTMEPFRWDQRLFSVLLRPPSASAPSDTAVATAATATTTAAAPGGVAGNTTSTTTTNAQSAPSEPQGSPSSHLTAMSEVTGGKCYVATCMKTLLGCVESVVGRLNPGGLVVNFDRLSLPDDPPPSFQIPPSPHRLLFLRPVEGRLPAGNWPLPESFPPDAILSTSADQPLPARVAHPIVLVREMETEPYIYANFPFDEYEVEPCPLTAALIAQLSQSKTGQVCCQVYAPNSGLGGGGIGEPFGFIKAARSRKTGHKGVTLVVLPYNYPKLWPLLDELINTHRNMPNHKWRKEFDGYLARVPAYYFPYLRAAFKRYSFPVPEHIEDGYTATVNTHLQKMKLLAQQRYDAERQRTKAARSLSLAGGDQKTREGGNGWWGVGRTGLLSHVKQLQSRLIFGAAESEKDPRGTGAHAVPIAQMGNYHEILRNQLRPIEEDPKRRAVFFGNPFVVARADKAGKMANMIDALDIEAAAENEGLGAAGAGLPLRSKKRKAMPTTQQLLLPQQQQQQQQAPHKPTGAQPSPAAKKAKLAPGGLAQQQQQQQQVPAAVGVSLASAVAQPTAADDQRALPPVVLHSSQAAQAEAAAGGLAVSAAAAAGGGGGYEEPNELLSPVVQPATTSSSAVVDDMAEEDGRTAVDDTLDEEEDEGEGEEDEEGEPEGELESGDSLDSLDSLSEPEREQERRRGSLPLTEEEDEDEDEEPDESEMEAEGEVPDYGGAAAEEIGYTAPDPRTGVATSKLFARRPLPRYSQANSERRAALVGLIRQRRTDEEAVLRLVEEMEGPHDERRRHASFAASLAQRWKKFTLSNRLLPYLST